MKGTNGVPPLPAAPGFTEPLCPGSRARLEMSAPGGNGALLQLDGPRPGAADAAGAARTGMVAATATAAPMRPGLMTISSLRGRTAVILSDGQRRDN